MTKLGMTRRAFARGAGFVLGAAYARATLGSPKERTRVSVRVLQLLKPTEVTITPAGSGAIQFTSERGTGVIWPEQSKTVRAAEGIFSVQGRADQDAHLRLTLPGGFSRDYLGRLVGTRDENDFLVLVIEMPIDVAVGSIVGAELPTHAAAQAALAAQAVVARSFLVGALATGGRRHDHSEFCDTTHCQFLGSPAQPGSPVIKAETETKGLVLMADGKPFPALYSAACGGRTEQRMEGGYLYQRLRCDPCANSHRARSGHGLGLCQNGALQLAREGWPWQKIVQKYYPAAAVGRHPDKQSG